MKNAYLKQSLWLLACLVIFVTGFDVLVTLLYPDYVRRFTSINIFFIVFALFTLFSPLGRTRLGQSPARYSFLKWLLLIFSMQLFSALMFINLLQVAYLYLPYDFFYTHYTIPTATHVMHTLFFDWGLFPWMLIALSGVLVGVLYYNKNQPGLLGLNFPTLRNPYYTLFFKRVINAFLMIETNFGIAVSLVLFILVINLWVLQCLGYTDAFLIRIGDYVFMCLISLLYVTKLMQKIILKRLVNHTRYISTAFIIFAITLILTLAVSHILAEKFLAPLTHSIPALPSTLSLHLAINWDILFWGWWVCWTPLLASFVAKISQGRYVYQIILAQFILPIIAALLIFFQVDLRIDWYSLFTNPLIALITPLFVLIFLHKRHGSEHLLFGFMPKKINAVALPVYSSDTTHNLFRVIISLVITFLFHNVFAIQVLVSLIAIPNILFFIYSCLVS